MRVPGLKMSYYIAIALLKWQEEGPFGWGQFPVKSGLQGVEENSLQAGKTCFWILIQLLTSFVNGQLSNNPAPWVFNVSNGEGIEDTL